MSRKPPKATPSSGSHLMSDYRAKQVSGSGQIPPRNRPERWLTLCRNTFIHGDDVPPSSSHLTDPQQCWRGKDCHFGHHGEVFLDDPAQEPMVWGAAGRAGVLSLNPGERRLRGIVVPEKVTKSEIIDPGNLRQGGEMEYTIRNAETVKPKERSCWVELEPGISRSGMWEVHPTNNSRQVRHSGNKNSCGENGQVHKPIQLTTSPLGVTCCPSLANNIGSQQLYYGNKLSYSGVQRGPCSALDESKPHIPPHRMLSYRGSLHGVRGAQNIQPSQLDPRRPAFTPRYDEALHTHTQLNSPHRKASHPTVWQHNGSAQGHRNFEDSVYWENYRLNFTQENRQAVGQAQAISHGQSLVPSIPPPSLVQNVDQPPFHIGTHGMHQSGHVRLCPHEKSQNPWAILGPLQCIQIPTSDPRPATASPTEACNSTFTDATRIHLGNHALNQLKVVVGGYPREDENKVATIDTLKCLIDPQKIDRGGSLQTRLHRLTCRIQDEERRIVDELRAELWRSLEWIASGGSSPIPTPQHYPTKVRVSQLWKIDRRGYQSFPMESRPSIGGESSNSSSYTSTDKQESGVRTPKTLPSSVASTPAQKLHSADVNPADLVKKSIPMDGGPDAIDFLRSPELHAYLDQSYETALGLQIALSLKWRKIHKVFTREWSGGISKHARRGVITRALFNIFRKTEVDCLRSRSDSDTEPECQGDTHLTKKEGKRKVGKKTSELSRVWNRRALCLECEPEAMAQDGYFVSLLENLLLEKVFTMESGGVIGIDGKDGELLLPKCPEAFLLKYNSQGRLGDIRIGRDIFGDGLPSDQPRVDMPLSVNLSSSQALAAKRRAGIQKHNARMIWSEYLALVLIKGCEFTNPL